MEKNKYKKLFIIIQPTTFTYNENDYPQMIKEIIIMDLRGKIILREEFNCKSYLIVEKILRSETKLITYNGLLLCNMIYKFWNRDDFKIEDLMEEFSFIYKEEKDWISSDNNPYCWKKLTDALTYYNVKKNDVNIFDPLDVIKKTMTLYRKMEHNGDLIKGVA